MNPQQLAALLGFLFVAAWAALGFGDALLCLVGAGAFYAATAFYHGELDRVELQQRLPQQQRQPHQQPLAHEPRGTRSPR